MMSNTASSAMDKPGSPGNNNGSKDGPDSAKKGGAGTGFFMPLTMRAGNSGALPLNEGSGPGNDRNKPHRRRTTGSLAPSSETHHQSWLNSTNLGTRRNPPRRHRSGSAGVISRIEEEQGEEGHADYTPMADVHAVNAAANLAACSFPASAYADHAASVAAALAAPAAPSRASSVPQQLGLTVCMPSSPPGLSQPAPPQAQLNRQQQLNPQQQLNLRRVNSMPPGSLSPRSSTGAEPELGSSLGGVSSLLQQRSSLRQLEGQTGDDAAAAAGINYSAPISSETLQTFFGPGALQSMQQGSDGLSSLKNASDNRSSLLRPRRSSSSAVAAAELASLQAAAAAKGGSPVSAMHAATSPSTYAAADPTSHILTQPSFSKWTVPAVENTSLAVSSDALEEHEGQIDKRINELMVMKQLLQLKQQHKQQQQLLQMQQMQQEQLLQQQLSQMQHSESSQGGPSKQVQQGVLMQQELLQPQRSEGSIGSKGVSSLQQQRQELLMQQQLLQVQRSESSGTSTDLGHMQQELLMQQQLTQQQQQQQWQLQSNGKGLTQLQQELLLLHVQCSDASHTSKDVSPSLAQLQQELLLQQQQMLLPVQRSEASSSSTGLSSVSSGNSMLLSRAMSMPMPGHATLNGMLPMMCSSTTPATIGFASSPVAGQLPLTVLASGSELMSGCSSLGGLTGSNMSSLTSSGMASAGGSVGAVSGLTRWGSEPNLDYSSSSSLSGFNLFGGTGLGEGSEGATASRSCTWSDGLGDGFRQLRTSMQ